MDVLARFANEGEEFLDGFDKAETELGKVYLPKSGIEYAQRLTLGFSSFVEPGRITVMGARPAKS